MGQKRVQLDPCRFVDTPENYVRVHLDKIMEELEFLSGDFNEVQTNSQQCILLIRAQNV